MDFGSPDSTGPVLPPAFPVAATAAESAAAPSPMPSSGATPAAGGGSTSSAYGDGGGGGKNLRNRLRFAKTPFGVTADGCREPAETRLKTRAKCRDRGWLGNKKPDFSRVPPAAWGGKVKISRVPLRACSVPDEISRAPRRSASVPGESRRAPARPASSPAAETVPEMRTAPRRWVGNRVSVRARWRNPERRPSGVRQAAYRPSAALLPFGTHASHGPTGLHLAGRDCDPTLCTSDFHFLGACLGRCTRRSGFLSPALTARPASSHADGGRPMGIAARCRVEGASGPFTRLHMGAEACDPAFRIIASRGAAGDPASGPAHPELAHRPRSR